MLNVHIQLTPEIMFSWVPDSQNYTGLGQISQCPRKHANCHLPSIQYLATPSISILTKWQCASCGLHWFKKGERNDVDSPQPTTHLLHTFSSALFSSSFWKDQNEKQQTEWYSHVLCTNDDMLVQNVFQLEVNYKWSKGRLKQHWPDMAQRCENHMPTPRPSPWLREMTTPNMKCGAHNHTGEILKEKMRGNWGQVTIWSNCLILKERILYPVYCI